MSEDPFCQTLAHMNYKIYSVMNVIKARLHQLRSEPYIHQIYFSDTHIIIRRFFPGNLITVESRSS